jgi:DNA-binding Xre family transcriptional regulator
MHMKDHFQDFVSDPQGRRIYEREALAFEASELISSLMEEQAVSKTKLAELIGTSKSHITQLLSGTRNMTMHTLADLAFVLGHKVEIRSSPLSAVNCRLDAGKACAAHTPTSAPAAALPLRRGR